jgi:hypothetical protein
VKVGDLVTRDRSHIDETNLFYNSWLRIGLILEWYDTPKGMVIVGWWRHGKLDETNPCHISKLEVINENE